MHPDQTFIERNGDNVLLAECRQAIAVLGMKGLLDAVNVQRGKGFQTCTCTFHAHLAERPIGIHT